MPLFWLSLAFLLGIVAAPYFDLPAGAWLVLAGLFLAFLYLPRVLRGRISLFPSHRTAIDSTGRLGQLIELLRARLTRLPFVLLPLFFALGGARHAASLPSIDAGHVAYYNDTENTITLQAVLIDLPDERDGFSFLKVRAKALRLFANSPEIPVKGLVQVYSREIADWRYGDELLLKGKISTPPAAEEFSYRAYLARHGVYSYMNLESASLVASGQGSAFKTALYGFKSRALDTVYRLWPDPEASLLAGILLGVESGIPKQVERAFQATGTSHIIAISGFNITIVAGLFTVLFSRLLGRFRGAVTAVLGIAAYTLLVGADPAVVRAALMGGLSLFARQVGRRQEGLNSLALVAAIMALFNPHILGVAGFQLSFGATLGLVLYAGPFSQWFVTLAGRRLSSDRVQRLAGPVGEYLIFTFAAQLTTLPIMALHFRQISLVSLIANPAILPAQPAVMVLGGLAVLLGMAWLPLGQLVGALAWPFAAYTIRMVELFALLPGGALALGAVGVMAVTGYYAILFAWTFAGARARQAVSAIGPGLSLVATGLLTMVVWQAALASPDGRLHLTVLDTNDGIYSGTALLIQSPTGRYVLINGGPSSRKLSDGLGRRLPFGHRRLDYLVVAQPRQEEIRALPEVIERFPSGAVLWAGKREASSSATALLEILSREQVPVVEAVPGQMLELGGGAQLRVLACGKSGGVFLLEWENFRAVLPVGMNFAELEALQNGRAIGPVSALLLADHGYAPVNPPEWINNLNPQVALLSISAGDRDGLPSPETLAALEGYTLLRTDVNGWVHLSTEGERMWVEVER